jgi:hypothetical protein
LHAPQSHRRNQNGVDFTAGESDGDQPSNQLEVLGSADEQLERSEIIRRQVPESETLNTEVTETNLGQRGIVEVKGESPLEISMPDPNDLCNLFANMLPITY